MVNKITTKKPVDGKSALALSMIPLVGAGILGGMMNMFFGNRKQEPKDTLKGVIDLAFGVYEEKIKRLEVEQSKLLSDNLKLKEELEKLKEEKKPKPKKK